MNIILMAYFSEIANLEYIKSNFFLPIKYNLKFDSFG